MLIRYLFFLFLGMLTYSQLCNAASSKYIYTYLQIEDINNALAEYHADTNTYPSSNEGLIELVENKGQKKGWNGPYLIKYRLHYDAWGEEYIYHYPPIYGTLNFDVYSKGVDMKDNHGQQDDITNWVGYSKEIYENKIFYFNPVLILIVVSIGLLALYYRKKYYRNNL